MKYLLTNILLLLAASSYAQTPIVPLNYSNAANWSAHPMKLFDLEIKPSYTILGPDTTDQTVINIPYPPANPVADVFVVSPTTLINSGGAPGLTPLDFVQKSAINFAIQLNFSQFGRFGRIYAPYYRQANLPAFSMTPAQQAQQAALFDTATTDVLAAFTFFMENNHTGKPVILLGHSQGSLVLAMMLRRMELNPALYGSWLDKIVVAVLPGMEGGAYVKAGETTGGWLEQWSFCQQTAETGCLMPWMTVKEGLLFQSSTPFGNHIPSNLQMADIDLKFKAFTAGQFEQSGDALGFNQDFQPVSRSIFPKIYLATGASDIQTDWVAYDHFYEGKVVQPNQNAWGISVRPAGIPGDQRHDPIEGALFADLHLYDLYILAGEVLEHVEAKVNALSAVQEQEIGALQIIPNVVTSGFISLSGPEQAVWVEWVNAQGQIVASSAVAHYESRLEIPPLPAGLYILRLLDSRHQVWVGKCVIL